MEGQAARRPSGEPRNPTSTVVASTGFHKTHVTTAAREASNRNILAFAITSVYPTVRVKAALKRLRMTNRGRWARLIERDEGIPDAQLEALFLPELLYEAARLVARAPYLRRGYPHLAAMSMRLYGWFAARKLRKRAPNSGIYQFRAGFGHKSVRVAHDLGLVTVCDHAIAHPLVLDELVARRGVLGDAVAEVALRRPSERLRSPTERAILADIDNSDVILVNSDFVKETFVRLGWSPDRVRVLYLGVDDAFLSEMPPKPLVRAPVENQRQQFLYAGRLERRKGAETLMEALQTVRDVEWELLIAGPITPDIRSDYRAFLKSDRVTLLGTLRRPELMRRMLSVPVFVFPSFAEGSARVVFEALACGCYVITTPNAGSIVEDGVHGALIPPGDAEQLAAAIVDANNNRQLVAEIGTRNAALVSSSFRQRDYGDALAELFRELVPSVPRTGTFLTARS